MSKKGLVKDRTGETHTTNEGYLVKIIECFSALNCTIQFENGIILYSIPYVRIRKGSISNPYHKSVYGVGYLGEGKYKTSDNGRHTKAHRTWSHMLRRSYSDNYHVEQPTYKEVVVCEEWHNFQVFAEWFEEKYNPLFMQKWELDKDILCKSCKIYSPKTCALVPQEINVILNNHSNNVGELPTGTTMENGKYLVRLSTGKKRIRVGLFNTKEEASKAYIFAKEAYIKTIANKWKDIIDINVYTALINFKFSAINK